MSQSSYCSQLYNLGSDLFQYGLPYRVSKRMANEWGVKNNAEELMEKDIHQINSITLLHL